MVPVVKFFTHLDLRVAGKNKYPTLLVFCPSSYTGEKDYILPTCTPFRASNPAQNPAHSPDNYFFP
jgi:hypothetical protein